MSFVQHILIVRLVGPLQSNGSGTPQGNGSFSSPGINKPSQNIRLKEKDVAPVVFVLYHFERDRITWVSAPGQTETKSY